MKRKSSASIIAATFASATSDISDYRYKATRTRQAIYATGSQYYAVSQARPTDDVGGPWKEHPDQFWAYQSKTTLWYCDDIESTRTSQKKGTK